MASALTIDHLTVTSDRFADSALLYDAALGALGLVRLIELTDEEEDDGELEGIGYGGADEVVTSATESATESATPSGRAGPDPLRSDARFWLVAGESPTRGLHVAFRAQSRREVEAFFASAVAAGAVSRQPPRRWEIFRAGYYGASVLDWHGNVIEAYLDE